MNDKGKLPKLKLLGTERIQNFKGLSKAGGTSSRHWPCEALTQDILPDVQGHVGFVLGQRGEVR